MTEASTGYLEGERLAKLSSWTLAGLGVVELIVGEFTGSVGLSADGIDSMSDAFVSLLVWIGLRASRKAADDRFHFGYYKIESLVGFVAGIGLLGVGAAVLYRSYLAFLDPKPLTLPALALVVLLAAGSISMYRAVQMRKIAGKYNLSSLKLDANNAIKDGSASFLVFFTVLASSLGFHFMDAIGGMAVALFIFVVCYVVIKQTFLVLVDAYHNPELVNEIVKIVGAEQGVKVKDVLLRATGPYVQGEIHIEVDPSITVGQLDKIKSNIDRSVKQKFSGIQRLVISARPSKD
ncbi:MAG: cation diffusion facilitator family transporter [Thaumarchaeota archaeon]|nr:cation diffusion facilitator family transporter [Nitrososphaerota archaeon]